MPETTLLQIRTRGSTTARTLELPGASVRVGRGPQCEVRLGEANLAEVQCLLRRRGETWHIQPVGPPGRISINGLPIEAQRPLPLGMPVRVGEHWLTLRPGDPPDIDRPIRPSAREASLGVARPLDTDRGAGLPPTYEPPPTSDAIPSPGRPVSAEEERERLARWEARLRQRERWLQAKQDENRWEARWRAAGEAIRAKSHRTPPHPAPLHTPPTGVPPRPAAPFPAEARIQAAPAPAPAPPEIRDDPAVDLPEPILPVSAVAPPEVAISAPPHQEPPEPPAEPPQEPPTSPDAESAALASLPALAAWVAEAEAPTDPEPEPVPRAIDPEPVPPPPTAEPTAAADRVAPPPQRRLIPWIRVSFLKPATPVEDVVEVEPAPAAAPPLLPIADATSEPMAVAVAEAPAMVPPVEAVAVTPISPAIEPLPEVETGPAVVVEPEIPAATVEADPPFVAPRDMPAPPAEFEASPRSCCEWPSARVILESRAACRPRPTEAPKTAARLRPLPEPTHALPPAAWRLPGGVLLAFPVLLGCLVVGSLGVFESAILADGDAMIGPLAGRVGPASPRDRFELPPSRSLAANPAWWNTRAEGLWLLACTSDRSENDPERAAQAGDLLELARAAAPASPMVRYAMAMRSTPKTADNPASWPLGLSRDVVTLTLTGKKLLAEGKRDAALRAFRSAIDLAADTEGDHALPGFDAKVTHRYLLPREELIAGVVRELVGRPELAWEQVAEVISPYPAAALVAARMLQERSRPEADAALRLALGDSPVEETSGNQRAVRLMARAEAFSLQDRGDDALAAYREAAELAADEPVRRMISFNLADIADRRKDDATARAALEVARGTGADDEIGRRARRALADLGRKAPANPGRDRAGAAGARLSKSSRD